jgi:dUTP pyrophosphatase
MKKGTIVSKVPDTEASNYVSRSNKRMLAKIVADSPEFIPVYATKGAACCDLKANIQIIDPTNFSIKKHIVIGTLETVKIDCGFSMQLPEGFEAQIRPRSSFGAKGLIVPNSPGTIDFDFRGRMCVLLTNLKSEPVTINHLDRIGQMALKPVWYFDFQEVDTLDNTDRGDGGFGSTGI